MISPLHTSWILLWLSTPTFSIETRRGMNRLRSHPKRNIGPPEYKEARHVLSTSTEETTSGRTDSVLSVNSERQTVGRDWSGKTVLSLLLFPPYGFLFSCRSMSVSNVDSKIRPLTNLTSVRTETSPLVSTWVHFGGRKKKWTSRLSGVTVRPSVWTITVGRTPPYSLRKILPELRTPRTQRIHVWMPLLYFFRIFQFEKETPFSCKSVDSGRWKNPWRAPVSLRLYLVKWRSEVLCLEPKVWAIWDLDQSCSSKKTLQTVLPNRRSTTYTQVRRHLNIIGESRPLDRDTGDDWGCPRSLSPSLPWTRVTEDTTHV